MTQISTHVLDIVRGKPAEGVPVQLERQEVSGSWRPLGSASTDQNGRCAQLLPKGEALTAGVYRLVFQPGNYFAAQRLASFYPLVEITFQVRDGESQFHIPLLLSPYGYTTYRGS